MPRNSEAETLLEAASKLVDICWFITPHILYNYLGDDAVIAAGLPLCAGSFEGDWYGRIDLSWANDAIKAAQGAELAQRPDQGE